MHRGIIYIPTVLSVAATLGALTVFQQYNSIRETLPPVTAITHEKPALTSRIYSRDGKLIGTLFQENRTWVPLAKISPNLKKAVIAVEDKRFYEHHGVDLPGVMRAAVRNFRGGSTGEGASTITMQLVRNVLNQRETTYTRKIREALLAWELEKTTSKDKILEMYLNRVYFGHGCYGVASAAQYYFGKKPDKLDISESSLLAGLPQSPEYLSSPDHVAQWRQRQIAVLNAMEEQDLVDQQKIRAVLRHTNLMAIHQRPHSGGSQVVLKYPYFTSYVIHELSQRYDPRTLYAGGLTVVTSLDTRAQRIAERTLKDALDADGSYYNAGQSALVAVDNQTGQIKAMVGGRKWSKGSQFNRAWQARRQAGSTFKAFVYATALENGYKPTDMVDDVPTKFSVDDGRTWWEPKNSDGTFLGPLPLFRALMLSRNVCSANLVASLRPETVLRTVQNLGMGQDAEPNLSIALGAVEVSPLQMAGAYTAIVNDGYLTQPTAILSVKDSQGHWLERATPNQRKVISAETAGEMRVMLQNVVYAGTGTAAALPNEPVAGKTGTSDSCKDGWFVGFTPRWTTAVWVGNDNSDPMWGCYGGTLPASIWHRFMASAAPASHEDSFRTARGDKPVLVQVCGTSGKPAGPNCKAGYAVWLDPIYADDKCNGCIQKKAPKLFQVASQEAHSEKNTKRANVAAAIVEPDPEPAFQVWEAEEPGLEPQGVDENGTHIYSNTGMLTSAEY